jgi:hypothetical protein
MKNAGKEFGLEIYPAYGETTQDGHISATSEALSGAATWSGS